MSDPLWNVERVEQFDPQSLLNEIVANPLLSITIERDREWWKITRAVKRAEPKLPGWERGKPAAMSEQLGDPTFYGNPNAPEPKGVLEVRVVETTTLDSKMRTYQPRRLVSPTDKRPTMRLKLTHKDGQTRVINADTGESLGVSAVRFERLSVDDLATITITLHECSVALDVDVEADVSEIEEPEPAS